MANLLFTYSYPASLRPRSMTELAAAIILSSETSQWYAFQEFQPSAGSLPYNSR
jgi:hypothetical protein